MSYVWKFYKKIDYRSVICNLCGQNYKSSGGTTNLACHLKSKHADEFAKLTKADLVRKKKTKPPKDAMDAELSIKSNKDEDYDESQSQFSNTTFKQDSNENQKTIEIQEKMLQEISMSLENDEHGTGILESSTAELKNSKSSDDENILEENVTPHRPRVKMSFVWKFYKKVDDRRVICKLCGQNYKSSGGTTNLATHLKHKHANAHINSNHKFFENETETDHNDENTKRNLSALRNLLKKCPIKPNKYDYKQESILGLDDYDHETEMLESTEEINNASVIYDGDEENGENITKETITITPYRPEVCETNASTQQYKDPLSVNHIQEDDEYSLFCRSVEVQLRSFPDSYHRSLAKFKIQQVLFEVETEYRKTILSTDFQSQHT